MTITATPTSKEPTHDISLQDAAGNKVGFIPVDSAGKENITAIRRFPLTRTGLKTATGSTKYSDFEEPYMSIPQDDWTGGRGSEDLDDDATKFYDSCSVDTSSASGVVLAGLPIYTSGYRSQNFRMPRSVHWQGLYGVETYQCRSFTPSVNYGCWRSEVIIRKVGNPGDLELRISSSLTAITAGDPKAIIHTNDVEDLVSMHISHRMYPVIMMPSGTKHYLFVNARSEDTATNHWEIAVDTDAAGATSDTMFRSEDGTTWIPTSSGIYFRVTDANVPFIARFFEYKRQLYFVRANDNGAVSRLYMNGDRGASDSNSADLSLLNDATKSWGVNGWANDIVMITAGPGSEENKPWRNIVSNTATAITVDENWNVAHTTSTEYVILGSDKWTQYMVLAEFVTDVAVADEFVYFAFGDNSTNNIQRYQEYNLSGVWTQRAATYDVVRAHQLLAIRDPARGMTLYGSRNNHPYYGVSVWKGYVPQAWGDLYTPIGELAPTNEPWDSWIVANATQTTSLTATKIAIAAGFTTGVAAVENLDAPIDISQGTRLGVMIHSDVTAAAADLKLVYDDVVDLGHVLSPTQVVHDTTAMPNALDGDTATEETRTLTTASRLYILSDVKFNQITFDFGGTVNAVASVLSVDLWTGGGWSNVAITDGTDTAGVTFSKDGTVTFTPVHDFAMKTVASVTGYAARLTFSVNLTAGVVIKEIQVTRKNNQYLSFPALVGNVWQWATMTYAPTEEPQPDDTAIRSVGLYVNTDLGAQNVLLRGGLMVLNETMVYQKLPNDARITNLVAYTNADTEQEIAWAVTENYLFKLDDGEGNFVAVPIPLKEMAGLRSETNGLGAGVNDVYLYFNLGDSLERYFNRNLDDVGPNRGAGLPEGRQGPPSSLVSYPGRLFAGIDNDEAGGNSSVLQFIDNNWHEVFRAPYEGRLRSIFVQSMPGTTSDRLWVNWGSNIVFVPLSISPYYDPNYHYIWEGHLISAWYYGGMQDVVKMWNSIKLFLENVLADHRFVKADYQVDDEDDTWTEITGTFDTIPVEEILISLANPPNITGRRFRYRLRFYTDDKTETPRLKASVIQAIGGAPVKYGYVWTFLLADKEMGLDRLADEDSTLSVVSRADQIDTWTRNATPLYMRQVFSVFDAKNVKIDPVGLQPFSMDENADANQGREKYYAQVTVLEL